MTTPAIPTEEQVLGWFDSLSNWGRWGDDDELGTLNLITDAKRKEAAGWCPKASASRAHGC